MMMHDERPQDEDTVIQGLGQAGRPFDEPAAAGVQADESALVARLRRGDEAAYELLIRQYGGRMLAVARRLLRNEDEARDAVQVAFLNAFRSMDGFREGARLSTWLHRIVTNVALMTMRKASRRTEVGLGDLLPAFAEDGHHAKPIEPWPADAESLLIRDEMRAYVRQCIEQLPAQYRSVLVLQDLEELSTAETARVLGISENAVKTRRHRARLALRTQIDQALVGSGAAPLHAT